MVDNHNDILLRWVNTEEGLQKCRSVYDNIMLGRSSRVVTIISNMEGASEKTPRFFKTLLKLTASDLNQIPGCGYKYRKEILFITYSLSTLLYQKMPLTFQFSVSSLLSEQPVKDVDEPFTLQSLLPQVNEAFSKYPVRVGNAIKALLMSCDYDVERFYKYITDDSFEYQKIRNIGEGSYQNALACLEEIKLLVRQHLPEDDPDFVVSPVSIGLSDNNVPCPLPWYVEKLHPLLLHMFEGLSVRSRHALEAKFKECNQSVKEFYDLITAPDFSILSLRNIGRGSVEEVSSVLDGVKSLIEQYSQTDSEEVLDEMLYDMRLSDIIPDSDSRQRIISFEKNEGYFPFFLAVKEIIDHSFLGRDHTIIEGMFRYREDQVLFDKDDIKSFLSISRERARQIRGRLIRRLLGYLCALHDFHPGELCHYTCLMNQVNKDINAKEGTSFTLDFVHWILGIIFDEYEYEGNPEWTFTTPSVKKAGFVALVPSTLVESFDFKGFINNLDDVIREKRQDDTGLSLRNLIIPHIRVKYYDEIFPDIEKACRSIIYLHYGLDIDYGIITFKANTYKPLPDIIYDLILKNHAPMTVQDLIEAIEYNYPERDFNPDIIGANALRHAGIVPMGRTGKYTLKEWCDGSVRGGTIREFVCEYLDSLQTPIASATDVGEYVRRFRPESTDTSISSNLIQERSRKFAIFMKDDVRYFGYSDREYDPCFKLISGDRARKRSTDVSMRLLEDFILQNSRYPYHCSDEEETRLYRFVGVRRSYYSKGTMTEQETEQWRAFEEKYGKYDIPHKRKRRTRQQIEEQTDVQNNLG